METPLEAMASLLVVVVIAMFAFAFIGQNFAIPSPSMMEKTLLTGNHFAGRSGRPLRSRRKGFHYNIIVRWRGATLLCSTKQPNPESPDLVLVKRVIGVPGDRIHLVHGIVYLNGVAQDEPYQQPPRDDGNPQHAYIPFRDDFPADIAGATAGGGCQSGDAVGAGFAEPCEEWRDCGASRSGVCDGRQPDREQRWAVLGVCADGEHYGPADVCLLVV